MARCLGWCGHRNFLTAKTGHFLCGMVQRSAAGWRVIQHPSSSSRAVLHPPGTWSRPPCEIMWEHEWQHNVPITCNHFKTPWCILGIWFSSIWILMFSVLKIVNWAVNVCSNLIGCFEVELLAPPLLLSKWDPQEFSLSYFIFFLFFRTNRSLCLAPSFCFASFCSFAFDFRQFFLKQGGLNKIGPLV